MKPSFINAVHQAAKAVIDKILLVREDDYQLFLELYCDNPSCPTREVHLHIKDLDSTLSGLLKRQGAFRCPLCGERVKMHWVMSSRQKSERDEWHARCSVLTQMRERDHRFRNEITGRDDLFVESAAEMTDDRLPPTPYGWFDKSTESTVKPRRFVRKGEE